MEADAVSGGVTAFIIQNTGVFTHSRVWTTFVLSGFTQDYGVLFFVLTCHGRITLVVLVFSEIAHIQQRTLWPALNFTEA